jgi:DNA processing protein
MTEWDDAERAAYLTLALLPGIGSQRLRALLTQFGSPSGALAAPFELLRATPGMNGPAARAVMRADRHSGRRALAASRRSECTLLTPGDDRFPECLVHIDAPPPVLFLLGDLNLLARPAVAIVGSRDHSAYGGEVARWLGRAAAAAGLAVVSGMARGLDALAHAGALDATGHTIGVLGNGIGVVYPAANRALYQAMSARGLLVSEWPPGERPTAGAFPRRNRLISGLARVTVVVEAAQKSGALQTANCAADQGREVMAVPGPIMSEVSKGTNELIRDGCQPLLEIEDLLAHYPELARPRVTEMIADGTGQSPLQRRITNLLRLAPRALTELCAGTDAPPAEVLSALTDLELAGAVRANAGGCYRLM